MRKLSTMKEDIKTTNMLSAAENNFLSNVLRSRRAHLSRDGAKVSLDLFTTGIILNFSILL